MKKYIPTVTVAFSAFNEEANIVNLLKSILMQKEEGFILKQIWIHSDASTDKTVSLAKSLKSNKIKVWNHKKRRGKVTWMNRVHKDLDTDFLVQLDADVVFAHKYVIRNIIKPFITNKKVGMCGGNSRPLKGNSFWEKMCYLAAEPYQEFRSAVRGGNNAFSAVGQLLAFRKEFAKNITIPTDMVIDDTFAYLCCLTQGWKYRYVKSATVFFQPPQAINDMIKQNARNHAGYYKIFQYFPAKLIKEEMSIPKLQYIQTTIKHVIRYPIFSICYFVLNKYAVVKGFQMTDKVNAKWSVSQTTKQLKTI